jgi:hypothetical protein
MVERSTITQTAQIGVEATPGTAVAATKRLGSLGISLGPSIETNAMRPIGQKYPSLQILGKEWAEADLEGAPVYTELPYLFASILGTPTVAAILDGATPSGATRWTFNTNSFGADVFKTYTIEQGDASRAHRVTHGLISELSFAYDREEVTIEGSLIARALEDGITMTSSGVTQLPQVPVRPTEVSIYLDNTAAAAGTTKMLRVVSGEWSMGGDRFQPVWVVDAAQPSFVAVVEGEPDFEFTLTQMADAQGMANLVALRAGATRFLQIKAVGPNIYTGTGGTPLVVNHQLTITTAGQISDVSQFDDEDGIYGIEWTFGAVHDATWGRATQVEVITTTSAL